MPQKLPPSAYPSQLEEPVTTTAACSIGVAAIPAPMMTVPNSSPSG